MAHIVLIAMCLRNIVKFCSVKSQEFLTGSVGKILAQNGKKCLDCLGLK